MKGYAFCLLAAFFAVLIGSLFVTGASSDIYLHKGLDAYKHGDYLKAEEKMLAKEIGRLKTETRATLVSMGARI